MPDRHFAAKLQDTLSCDYRYLRTVGFSRKISSQIIHLYKTRVLVADQNKGNRQTDKVGKVRQWADLADGFALTANIFA